MASTLPTELSLKLLPVGLTHSKHTSGKACCCVSSPCLWNCWVLDTCQLLFLTPDICFLVPLHLHSHSRVLGGRHSLPLSKKIWSSKDRRAKHTQPSLTSSLPSFKTEQEGSQTPQVVSAPLLTTAQEKESHVLGWSGSQRQVTAGLDGRTAALF